MQHASIFMIINEIIISVEI